MQHLRARAELISKKRFTVDAPVKGRVSCARSVHLSPDYHCPPEGEAGIKGRSASSRNTGLNDRSANPLRIVVGRE